MLIQHFHLVERERESSCEASRIFLIVLVQPKRLEENKGGCDWFFILYIEKNGIPWNRIYMEKQFMEGKSLAGKWFWIPSKVRLK